MPSSSARCAQFPRAQDKVHFYIKLKQLRDQIKGFQPDTQICEVGYSFNLEKATELAKVKTIKQERFDPDFEALDPMKNGPSLFPTFASSAAPTTSNNIPDGKYNGLTLTSQSNSTTGLTEKPGVSGVQKNEPLNSKVNPQPSQKKTDAENLSSQHSNLIRYLQQDMNEADSDSKKKGGVVMPMSLSPGNPKLQEDVSPEQKQERVGNWVRQQQNLEYDSDPPMGLERREDESANVQESAPAQGVDDGASQLSAISAGVSGSTSESTSGYGSIDASSRRVRLDRVEMWVMEQQHVGRHGGGPHQQQSSQTATNHHHAPVSAQNRLSPNPVNGWQQVTPQTVAGHTVPGSTVTQPGQTLSNVARNTQRICAALSSHTNGLSDQISGPSVLLGVPDRLSPQNFLRSHRRDGDSAGVFNSSIRPPVPLFSSWGGGEASGISVASSHATAFVSNPPTQSNPTQPYVTANSVTTNQSAPTNINSILPVSWQTTTCATNSVPAPNYHI